MGFDVSYHPIKEDEMKHWFFDRLPEVKNGDMAAIFQLQQEYQVDDFYIKKYIDTMNVAIQTTQDVLFDKSFGYYLAVVQGFFRVYFYTRGTAFSFLIEENSKMKQYTKSWEDILDVSINNPIANKIVENYCSGVYMSYEQLVNLQMDYESNEIIKKTIDDFFEENITVFMKALTYCVNNHMGMLEATEVIEPNPISLNDSSCYSNLMNCDTEGALLYAKIAKRQINEFAQQHEMNADDMISKASYVKTTSPKTEENVKKGLWKRLFGK